MFFEALVVILESKQAHYDTQVSLLTNIWTSKIVCASQVIYFDIDDIENQWFEFLQFRLHQWIMCIPVMFVNMKYNMSGAHFQPKSLPIPLGEGKK